MSRPRPSRLAIEALRHRLPDGSPLLDIPRFALADERLGLIGPNGSGKSTLLGLIAGDLTPTAGRVTRPMRVGHVRQRTTPRHGTVADALGVGPAVRAIARAEQGVASAEELAVVGDAWALPGRITVALDALGLAHLPLDRPLAQVSGGEGTRLALAAQLLAAPDLLLLDEPTNDLDAESRRAVAAMVRAWPRALLVATHDRALLGHVDRIAAIERGTLQLYGGNWTAYVAQRETARAAAEREFANAVAEEGRQRRHAQAVRERQDRRDGAGRRSRRDGSQPSVVLNARRERSEGTGARLRNAAARQVDAAAMRRRAARDRLEEQDGMAVVVPPSGLAAGTTVVALRDVTAGPAAEVALLHGVTFAVRGPERVAVVGPNGAGKSTVLRLVAGLAAPIAGALDRGVPVTRVSFLDQEARLLDVGDTVLDAFTHHHSQLDVTAVRAALARFQFRAGAALQRVATLSGGERMRAALACVLAGAAPPQCLVLDEPSNHLDLEQLAGLEAALRAYDGAVVIASHDEALLDAIGITRREDVRRWRR